jgi:RNA polymerase sigma-70 factor (ECF subfamily)
MIETELLESLRSGKAGAFEELVLQYQDKVIDTCYRFVHNQQDAEDVAQDVFIEIYQSIGDFHGQSSLSTWVYRIAVTKSLDFVRRKNRKKRLGHLQRFFGFKDKEACQTLELKDSADPHKDLEQKERAAALCDAVASLPQNQRVAITLNKYEGFSSGEIADIMGTTVASVESLIHRAKKNLRKKLYRYYDRKIE